MDASILADARAFVSAHYKFPDRFPLLARIRETGRIVPVDDIRLVTRYDHLVEGYRDQRLSRQAGAIAESQAHSSGSTAPNIEKARKAFTLMLINQDDPGHARIRKILETAFKPTRVASWATVMQQITDELLANVAGRESFDFRKELAFPLPERIICALMGVPYEDHDLWAAWTEEVVSSARSPEPTPDKAAAVDQAQIDFYNYFQNLVAERRKNLGEDLVSLLIRAESEGERLSELELIGALQMLIQAGHETTGNLINNGMYTLLKHPDQYERLRANPDLVPTAVEEMLRFCSPSIWSLPRIALTDVPLGEEIIPKGATLLMSLEAANRDPSRIDDPDRFDIGRTNNYHVGFAAGVHFCMGNQFARLEAGTMFRAIATRLPRLELVEEPRLKETWVRSYEDLQVRVTR